MGNIINTSIGSKSSYYEELSNDNVEIDYGDLKNEARTKQELYDLFLNNEIVHSSVVNNIIAKQNNTKKKSSK